MLGIMSRCPNLEFQVKCLLLGIGDWLRCLSFPDKIHLQGHLTLGHRQDPPSTSDLSRWGDLATQQHPVFGTRCSLKRPQVFV